MKVFGIATALLFAGFYGAAAQVPEPPPFQGQDEEQVVDEPPATEAETNDPEAASFAYFHQELAPYGEWNTREDVGEVWVPRVPEGWRPYTNGHWAYTDQGWGWVADEPWGWAAFHYGRWAYYQDLGWSWIPGNVWAPAWVAWRQGPGYVGWAPLPPSVEFSVEEGLGIGAAAITAGFFSFVAERDFLAPRVESVILSSSRNVTIIHNCRDNTRYPVFGRRVFNAGLDVRHVEQVTHRAVPRLQVASMAGRRPRGEAGAFYQPPVVSRAARAAHGEFGALLPPRVAARESHRGQRFTASDGSSRPETMNGRRPGSRSRTGNSFDRPDPATQFRRNPPGYVPDRTSRSRRDTPSYTPDRTRQSSDTRRRVEPVQPVPHYHSNPSRVQPRPQRSSQPRPQPKTQPRPRSSEKSQHRP